MKGRSPRCASALVRFLDCWCIRTAAAWHARWRDFFPRLLTCRGVPQAPVPLDDVVGDHLLEGRVVLTARALLVCWTERVLKDHRVRAPGTRTGLSRSHCWANWERAAACGLWQLRSVLFVRGS